MTKERTRYGVWSYWLPKREQAFGPILKKVAKKLGFRESKVIGQAVLEFLARHDDDAAELLRARDELRKGD